MKSLWLALCLLSAPAWACEGLQISDAWIREAPPGAQVMAGYARLVNQGAKALTIDSASAADFGSVMLHRSVEENGRSRMEHVHGLSLKPGESAVFAPSGLHLMLMDPKRELRAGDSAKIELRCGAQAKSATFQVKKPE